MSILELKQKYNILISREKKAEQYFKENSVEQCEKWMPQYNKIIIELSKLMMEYKKITRVDMTDNEVFNGFNGAKYRILYF